MPMHVRASDRDRFPWNPAHLLGAHVVPYVVDLVGWQDRVRDDVGAEERLTPVCG